MKKVFAVLSVIIVLSSVFCFSTLAVNDSFNDKVDNTRITFWADGLGGSVSTGSGPYGGILVNDTNGDSVYFKQVINYQIIHSYQRYYTVELDFTNSTTGYLDLFFCYSSDLNVYFSAVAPENDDVTFTVDNDSGINDGDTYKAFYGIGSHQFSYNYVPVSPHNFSVAKVTVFSPRNEVCTCRISFTLSSGEVGSIVNGDYGVVYDQFNEVIRENDLTAVGYLVLRISEYGWITLLIACSIVLAFLGIIMNALGTL